MSCARTKDMILSSDDRAKPFSSKIVDFRAEKHCEGVESSFRRAEKHCEGVEIAIAELKSTAKE